MASLTIEEQIVLEQCILDSKRAEYDNNKMRVALEDKVINGIISIERKGIFRKKRKDIKVDIVEDCGFGFNVLFPEFKSKCGIVVFHCDTLSEYYTGKAYVTLWHGVCIWQSGFILTRTITTQE